MSSDAVFNRLTSLLPVQDKELYALYEKALRTFWTHDEVDLSLDVVQWNEQLSKDERFFLAHVLGFFVQRDQLVNINLSDRFIRDIDGIPDWYRKYARLFYNAQVMIEDIHTLSYETMINEFMTDPRDNAHFKNSIANIPCIARKAEWAACYINDQESEFPLRLIAFAILEGIFFSGSFCSIFWIEQKNLLRGLTHYNKLIQRDENLHYEFALTLYRKLRDDPSVPFQVDSSRIVDMVTKAVDIETEFINYSIPCAMIGMNVDLMTQYIKFVADQLFKDIQLPTLYNVSNPFSFMVALGVVDRENFFEVRPSVYSKPILAETQYDSDASDF
ncbi:Ribonucleotide reductase-related [Phytophthora cactorum]|nr:Ribonucleotide reductase-related [Phytophthora cactorum]